MEKYTKIKNRGLDLSKYLYRGFYVQEKLDGSNASFTINDGELQAFSRRTKLSEKNTLNGFYDWVQEEYDNIIRGQYLLEDYIFFGEWLVKHKVKYKEEAYKQFYLFDIYDKERNEYLSYSDVEFIGRLIKLKQPETFLIAESREEVESVTVEDIVNLAGQSTLTEDGSHGEGVVVKYLDGKKEDEEYYKIVTKEFREIQGAKEIKPKVNHECIADYAITPARLDKMIFRAIDEGRLKEEDIHIENFGNVMKEVGNEFVEDILEEELDSIMKLLRKQIQKKVPILLREKFLNESNEHVDNL